jgi:hypothetical protein
MIAPNPLMPFGDLASFVTPDAGCIEIKRFFGFVW